MKRNRKKLQERQTEEEMIQRNRREKTKLEARQWIERNSLRGKEPPSIVCKQKVAWGHVTRAMKQARIRYLKARNEAVGIRILPQTSDDYRGIRCLLNTFMYPYYTYTFEEDKRQHVVIHGLAETKYANKIYEGLRGRGLQK